MCCLSAVFEEAVEGGRLGTGESQLLVFAVCHFSWNAWVGTTTGVFLLLKIQSKVTFERVNKVLLHLSLQIDHVHFLYRPSPDFPPSVLCACLRSALKVTSFSRVCGPAADPSCPGDGLLPRLILEKNLGVSDYLWLCHLSSQLSHR